MIAQLLLAAVSSVALYKNGQMVVTREVTPENGVALVEAKDAPAHGTFWHSANKPLDISLLNDEKRTEITFYADPSLAEILERAKREANLTVTPFDRSADRNVLYTLSGKPVAWNNDYRFGYSLELDSGSKVNISSHIVVAIAQGTSYWKFEGVEAPFTIQYLTSGAIWAPSYRFVLKGENKGLLAMACDIRNGHEDWENTEVSLISGFPSIAFASAKSLLTPQMTLDDFLAGLGVPNSGNGRARLKGAMSRVAMNYEADDLCEESEIDPSAYSAPTTSTGAGADVHVRSLGKLTLKKGATIEKPLGAAEANYRRIVEWTVADDSKPWDAIELTNPFDFPLTTAPIEVMEAGRILGQAQITWTNPQEKTLVKITPALSVKGSFYEESDSVKPRSSKLSSSSQETRMFRGSNWTKLDFKTLITLENYRKEPATIRVIRKFEGEVVKSNLQPIKAHVLPQTQNNPNVTSELTWELTLGAGEKKTITFEGVRWSRW